MKLLFCRKCADVFKLDYELRHCKCGETSGVYKADGLHATYHGPCVPLGFNNRSLSEAMVNQPATGWGVLFEAFVIAKNCDTFVEIEEI